MLPSSLDHIQESVIFLMNSSSILQNMPFDQAGAELLYKTEVGV
jgi:hypothetical protein